MTFVCGYIIINLYPQKVVIYLGIKKGVKLTEIPKDKTLKFRYSSETEKMLNELCEKNNKTKSQVIRDGIEIQYNKIKK